MLREDVDVLFCDRIVLVTRDRRLSVARRKRICELLRNSCSISRSKRRDFEVEFGSWLASGNVPRRRKRRG